MAQHVAVVTDSSACLPVELAALWGVTVIPLQVVIDGDARAEGSPGLADEVVEALLSGRTATTSQPSLAVCAEYFERAATHADAVVAVSLSASMSGTSGAMTRAAQMVGVPVTVVDSRTVGAGVGLAALAAAAAAAEGADAERVAREANRVARSALNLFTVESLEYLRRGGRMSTAVSTVANALSIRPLLGVVSGEIEVVERVRTVAKARSALIDRIASRAPAMRSPAIALMTLPGDEELATQARASLAKRGPWPVAAFDVSAVLAVHSGPGTLAAVVADVGKEVAQSLADVVPR